MARRAPIFLLAGFVLTTASACSPILYLAFMGRSTGGDLGLGQEIEGSTNASGSSFSPSCAGDGPDNAHFFVPTRTAMYRVHLESDYDGVLAIYQDEEELACDDDFENTSNSRVDLELTAGVQYSVVVDGYNGASGSYQLRIEHVPLDEVLTAESITAQTAPEGFESAPAEDVGMTEQRCAQAPRLDQGIIEGAIIPGEQSVRVSCGNGGRGPEALYRIVLEEETYVRVREESEFDAVLEIRRGCSEGHEAVVCADDAPDVHRTQVAALLPAGTYTLVVDAYAAGVGGPFLLEVSFEEPPEAAPADGPADGPTTPQTETP